MQGTASAKRSFDRSSLRKTSFAVLLVTHMAKRREMQVFCKSKAYILYNFLSFTNFHELPSIMKDNTANGRCIRQLFLQQKHQYV